MSLAGNAYTAAEKVRLGKLTGLVTLSARIPHVMTFAGIMYSLAVIQYIVPWHILYVI